MTLIPTPSSASCLSLPPPGGRVVVVVTRMTLSHPVRGVVLLAVATPPTIVLMIRRQLGVDRREETAETTTMITMMMMTTMTVGSRRRADLYAAEAHRNPKAEPVPTLTTDIVGARGNGFLRSASLVAYPFFPVCCLFINVQLYPVLAHFKGLVIIMLYIEIFYCQHKNSYENSF